MKKHLYHISAIFAVCLSTSFVSLAQSNKDINEPIVAYDDHFTTAEGANGFIYVISNDIDVENNIDTASLTIVSSTAHGSVQIYPDGKVYYAPNNGYFGNDSFTYSICDHGSPSTCDQALVTITINEYTYPNHIIVNDDHVTTFVDQSIEVEVMFNDMDPDATGVPLDSLKIIENAGHGSTVINYNTGKILYSPDAGFLGLDTFYYRSCDMPVDYIDSISPSTCAEGMVTVHVIPQNGLSVSSQKIPVFNAYLKDDVLHIQSEDELQGSAYVYASNGQIVLQEKISKEIPFSPNTGIYFLILETSQGVSYQKLIQVK